LGFSGLSVFVVFDE